jgi:hypothetical protein
MKTIREVEDIAEGIALSPAGPKRKRLRARLRTLMIKSSGYWYRRGFRRGHQGSFREFMQKGRVPITLTAQVDRELIPGIKKTIDLKSTLSKAFRKRASS